MDRDITVQELKPCDILLYHGDSTVAQLIQWFDGSEYSHSSVYDGEMSTQDTNDLHRMLLAEIETCLEDLRREAKEYAASVEAEDED